MKRDLSPATVAIRLEHLRSIVIAENVEDARRRLDSERPKSVPFAQAVAARLSELRALSELTAHLHARRRAKVPAF